MKTRFPFRKDEPVYRLLTFAMFCIVDFSMAITVFVNGLVMTLRKSSFDTLSSSLIPGIEKSWIDGVPQGDTLGLLPH